MAMLPRKDFIWPSLTLALLLAIAIVSGWLRAQTLSANYSHPDEEIARAVVSKVLATKKKDTNWARTDVEKMFRYNQFNFSAYYLSAAKIEKFRDHAARDVADSRQLIANLRQENIWWASVAVLLSGLLGWRLASVAGRPRFAYVAGFAAALMTAACVTLFQDSIYARPEAFVTVLTLLFVLVLLAELRPALTLVLSGALLGILIATKITFAIFLPFPLMVIVARTHAEARMQSQTNHQAHPWHIAGAGLAYLLCIVAGFGLGAPYALRAPWEYLEGIGYLLHQYHGEGWSRIHGGLAARIAHGINYLIYTDGIFALLLASLGIFVLIRHAKHALTLALAGPLLTLVYFLQTRAFFERNFSHALPVLFAASGLGLAFAAEWVAERGKRNGLLQALATCALLSLAVYPAWSISAKLREVLFDDKVQSRIDNVMREAGGGDVPVLFGYSGIAQVPELRRGLCGKVIYKLLDQGDPLTRQQLDALDAQGYRVAASMRGPFDGAPYSTLQSYHSSNVVFLASPPDPADAHCKGELITPVPDSRYVAIDAAPTLTGEWARNAFPPDMSLHGWPHPFYASWNGSDANTGDFFLGPFHACGELVVPYAIGPMRDGLELTIEREVAGQRETILRGAPPPSITWTAIRIPATPGCAYYTIRATDHGTGYGQWLGVGIPVELRPAATAAQPTPTSPAAASSKSSLPTTQRPRTLRAKD